MWFQPSWVVRTAGPVSGLTEQMQRALSSAAPALPFSGFYSMTDLMHETLAMQRVEVALLGAMAGLALLLSAVGIFSLVASMVAQRTREIGIRIALGSSVRRAMAHVGAPGLRASAIRAAAGPAALRRRSARDAQRALWSGRLRCDIADRGGAGDGRHCAPGLGDSRAACRSHRSRANLARRMIRSIAGGVLEGMAAVHFPLLEPAECPFHERLGIPFDTCAMGDDQFVKIPGEHFLKRSPRPLTMNKGEPDIERNGTAL